MSDKINWNHVNKWVAREGIKTNWKVYGMPEILDPFSSRFADVEPMPRWNISNKVLISCAITGAFFSKRSNPHQPISVDEIRDSAEACIEAGAASVHIHVRDDNGFNALSPERFRAVIEPLRARYPDVIFDGCLVAVTDEESQHMAPMMQSGLFDVVPINAVATCCGDNMFYKAPHAIIEKTRMALEAGVKPQIAVYDDGDIDTARRYLIDSGLVPEPHYWILLPALPGCSPMRSPENMVEGLLRMVRLIRDASRDPVILVCAAGRPSTYLGVLAMLLGLHVRVGMEDTVWPWPHRDDIIQSNESQFRLMRGIAQSLGRELMSPSEYRTLVGLPAAGKREKADV